MEDSYHYQVIDRAIRLIDQDGVTDLGALAEHLSMSPAHFQKLFSAWVGISPKRYAQYLKLVPARQMLRRQTSLMEASLNIGLSGTARLHDLFIRWEAMSPGEYARQGEGLTIYYGQFDSPFGPVLAMGTARGLCGMGFVTDTGLEAAYDDLAKRWPKAEFKAAIEPVANWVRAAFEQSGESRLLLTGRPFQLQVWEALMHIPEGQIASYGGLAEAIGAPKAARAVGNAVGQNPISLLIPCHRAIRASGGLGGYHWGTDVKRRLLAWELARTTGENLPIGDTQGQLEAL